MAQLISASVCLTDLVEKAKAGHSAFARGKNGKVYTALTIWLNDEPDQYGNHMSLQLNSTKDKKESEGKTYVGNGKVMSTGGAGEPVKAGEIKGDLSNLPF